MSIDSLAQSELARRQRRNNRDKLARAFLKDHPELIDSPDAPIAAEDISEGTSEAAIRAIARHYGTMKRVREYLKSQNGRISKT